MSNFRFLPAALAAAALSAAAGQASAQGLDATLLYLDAFNTDTNTSYTVVSKTESAGVAQIPTVTFGTDYSGLDGNPPEAPNTSGSDAAQQGMVIQGNITGADTTEFATSVYALFTPGISGDHRFTVDYYYNYNAAAGGGSTETANMGILASGTKVNNLYASDPVSTDPRSADTDGYYASFAADGGYSSGDIGFIEGTPDDTPAPELDPANPEFTWGSFVSPLSITATSTSTDYITDGFDAIFGTPNFINKWVTLRMTAFNGSVLWEVDSGAGFTPVAEYNDVDDSFTSGLPFVGAADHFVGSQNPSSAHIFDNFRVDRVTPSPIPAAAGSWNLYR